MYFLLDSKLSGQRLSGNTGSYFFINGGDCLYLPYRNAFELIFWFNY
jgi:hypothetical protein